MPITGGIPSSFGRLSSLTSLQVWGTSLSGSLPDALGSLSGLQSLSLSNNQFSGTVPNALSSMTGLTGLALNANQLSGIIPSWLWRMTSLVYLSLQNNALSGTIADDAGRMPALNSLQLTDNLLSGTVPASLGSLTTLQSLLLSGNSLTGPIPNTLGGLTRLSYLYLSNNQLSGPLPATLFNLSATLSQLAFASNLLSGPVPSWLGNMSALYYLILSGSGLCGAIPSSLASFCMLPHTCDFDPSATLPCASPPPPPLPSSPPPPRPPLPPPPPPSPPASLASLQAQLSALRAAYTPPTCAGNELLQYTGAGAWHCTAPVSASVPGGWCVADGQDGLACDAPQATATPPDCMPPGGAKLVYTSAAGWVCDCAPGYSGVNCSVKSASAALSCSAPPQCSSQGSAGLYAHVSNSWQCVCYAGWTGADCATPLQLPSGTVLQRAAFTTTVMSGFRSGFMMMPTWVGVATDALGSAAYVVDTQACNIVNVALNGSSSVYAGPASCNSGTCCGYVDAQTRNAAQFSGNLLGLAFDSASNLYALDCNYDSAAYPAASLRKISRSGSVTTLANVTTWASSLAPIGIAVDSKGNVFVPTYYALTRISAAGVVTVIAGDGNPGVVDGPFLAARFGFITSVAVDGNDDVIVADSGSGSGLSPLIRKLTMSTGLVSTLAGGVYAAGFADGLGTAAVFGSQIMSIAADAYGNVFVADTRNNRIRCVLPDQTVATVAGNGAYGNDAGFAATFSCPSGIAVSSDGSSLYVLDILGNVRHISFALRSQLPPSPPAPPYPPPYPGITTWAYEGCWNDCGSEMSGLPRESNGFYRVMPDLCGSCDLYTWNSIQKCQTTAVELGLDTVGVQAGGQCFGCKGCDFTVLGQSSAPCPSLGGGCTNQVYKLRSALNVTS